MPEKIYIGNFPKGLQSNRIPLNIDNEAMTTLFNMYVWRGRAKRKRGTKLLGQLARQIQLASMPNNWQYGTFNLDGMGSGNLISNSTFSLESTSTITPGSISIVISAQTYTDLTLDGNLTGGSGGTGTINYATGAITITGGGSNAVSGTYTYYPGLPVMGLEDYASIGSNSLFPISLFFDTVYSYQIFQQTNLNTIFSVSYYKNTNNPIIWSGLDYQQFWTTNYEGALWATNNKPGFHFLRGTYVSGSGGTTITFNFKNGASNFTTLVVNDVLWFNEWGGEYTIDPLVMTSPGYTSPIIVVGGTVTIYVVSVTGLIVGDFVTFAGVDGTSQLNGKNFQVTSIDAVANTFNIVTQKKISTAWRSGGIVTVFNTSNASINGITGIVTSTAGAASGNYVVTFASNQTVASTGIAQMLTNSIPGQDGIRWYDGDMTSNTGLPTNTNNGWVNFSPPLTGSDSVSISNSFPGLYYLVGALAILPYKDRLLFFSPAIQTSSGAPIILADTVLWSWNGTPFYTTSSPSTTMFAGTPSLVPTGQTANTLAYYVDQAGTGGYISAGISVPIVTVNANEDNLIVGFGGNGRKTRLFYTSNDLNPFLFYSINNELPSGATFSAINFDTGVIDMGQYGFAITDQQSSKRIDLEIPYEIFKIQNLNNGFERVNAIRDFYNEWIYFSYPPDTGQWKFPTQTFIFNYRDNTWGILYENYTTHGNFREQILFTWATIPFPTWEDWNETWDAGLNNVLVPDIIAGNPQGYVILLDQGTGEDVSGTITAIDNVNGNTKITSTNHCLTATNSNTGTGDYVQIQNALLFSTITGITLGNPTIITTTNTWNTGIMILIEGIVGTTQLNGNLYEILSQDASSISIDVDSTMFTAWSSGGTVQALNTQIAKVIDSSNVNYFIIDLPYPGGSYVGLGQYVRLSQPLLQTKQFAVFMEQGRQTIIGPQQYLFTRTSGSQCTLNLYLSMDPITAYNDPTVNTDGLVSTQLLYTCPESYPSVSNLSSNGSNNNLQNPIATNSAQIWHRNNTCLIGDSVQVGITLSDAQMRNYEYATGEIELHGMILQVSPGPMLA